MTESYSPANSYHLTTQVLTDSDDASAASIAPAIEGLADNCRYLYERGGTYRVVSIVDCSHAVEEVIANGYGGAFDDANVASTEILAAATGITVKQTDRVEVFATFRCYGEDTSVVGEFALAWQTTGASPTVMAETRVVAYFTDGAGKQVTLMGAVHGGLTSGTTEILRLFVLGRRRNGNPGSDVYIVGPMSACAKVLRSNA